MRGVRSPLQVGESSRRMVGMQRIKTELARTDRSRVCLRRQFGAGKDDSAPHYLHVDVHARLIVFVSAGPCPYAPAGGQTEGVAVVVAEELAAHDLCQAARIRD